MPSQMSISDMLRVVQGNDNMPAGFSDWYCGICSKSVSRKSDLMRHWRCPISCQADGCCKTYRCDKFEDYCNHHRRHHTQDGRPLFTVADLKQHFDDQTTKLKNVINPMYCPKSLAQGKFPTNNSIANCASDMIGFEPGPPPSEIAREERGGVELDTYHLGFDILFSESDVLALEAHFADRGGSCTTPPLADSETRYESPRQPIQANIGLEQSPESSSSATCDRRTQLVAQINVKKIESDNLDQIINTHYAQLLRGQNEAYHLACIQKARKQKQDLDRTVQVLQERHDSLA